MKSILVYVAGPYRAAYQWKKELNIFNAKDVGAHVAMSGFYPVIPHANTAEFEGLPNTDDTFWLEGTMELMRRCDAVVLTCNWDTSSGARTEKAEAERIGIPVFYSISDLEKHFRK